MLARREDIAPECEGGGPMRQCAVTRERAPKAALLRLVLGPDATPFVDVIGRAPGRGVYVKCDPDTLRRALSPKGIGRTFRGKARCPSSEAVDALLRETKDRIASRLLEMTGIARRAGLLELGMDPVLRALEDKSGTGCLVLVARDLGAASARKLDEAVSRGSESVAAQVIHVATKQELGSTLGRSEVGVVAIRASRHADRMMSEADRLRSLEGQAGASPEIPLTDPVHPEHSVGGAGGGGLGTAGEVN